MSCSRNGLRSSAALSLLISLTLATGSFTHNAYALSELRPAQAPASETEKTAQEQQATEPDAVEGDSEGIPLPDPLVNRGSGQQATPEQPQISAQIEHDISKAPEPVRRLRQLIIDAAATGDIEKLRPLVNTGPNQARIDGDSGNDPIAALKSFSGDPMVWKCSPSSSTFCPPAMPVSMLARLMRPMSSPISLASRSPR